MRTISKTVLAAALSVVFVGTAQASNLDPVKAGATLDQVDTQALFGAAEPLALLTLSDGEMQATEGAWFAPIIGFSAAGGAMGAFHSYRTTGRINWRDVGAGATAGFYASPMISRALGPTRAFGMGALGSYSWYWWE